MIFDLVSSFDVYAGYYDRHLLIPPSPQFNTFSFRKYQKRQGTEEVRNEEKLAAEDLRDLEKL